MISLLTALVPIFTEIKSKSLTFKNIKDERAFYLSKLDEKNKKAYNSSEFMLNMMNN